MESEKYLKTKIKSHEGKVTTIFHKGKIIKESFHYICLLMALIDSVLKKDNNCYP